MGKADFIDFKALYDEMAPKIAKDNDGNLLKLSAVKLLRFEKIVMCFFIRIATNSYSCVFRKSEQFWGNNDVVK